MINNSVRAKVFSGEGCKLLQLIIYRQCVPGELKIFSNALTESKLFLTQQQIHSNNKHTVIYTPIVCLPILLCGIFTM